MITVKNLKTFILYLSLRGPDISVDVLMYIQPGTQLLPDTLISQSETIVVRNKLQGAKQNAVYSN